MSRKQKKFKSRQLQSQQELGQNWELVKSIKQPRRGFRPRRVQIKSPTDLPGEREKVLLLVVRHGVLALCCKSRMQLWPLFCHLNRRLFRLVMETRSRGFACDWYYVPSLWEHRFRSDKNAKTISFLIQEPNFAIATAKSVTSRFSDPQCTVNLGLGEVARSREDLFRLMRDMMMGQPPHGGLPELSVDHVNLWNDSSSPLLRRGLLPGSISKALRGCPLMDHASLIRTQKLLSGHVINEGQLVCWRGNACPSTTQWHTITQSPREIRWRLKSQCLDRDNGDPQVVSRPDLHWWGEGVIDTANACPIIRLCGETFLGGHRSALLYWLSLEAKLQQHWDLVPLCFPLKSQWRDAILLLSAIPWPWSRVSRESRLEALSTMLMITAPSVDGEKKSQFAARMGGIRARKRLLRHMTWMVFHHEVSPDSVDAINWMIHQCLEKKVTGDLAGGFSQMRSCHGSPGDWSYVLWFLHHANDELWSQAMKAFRWENLCKFCSGTRDAPVPHPGTRDRSSYRNFYTYSKRSGMPSRDRLWRVCHPFTSHQGTISLFWRPSWTHQHFTLHFPHVRLGRAITRWLKLPHPHQVGLGAPKLEKWLICGSSPQHPDDSLERALAFQQLILLHRSSGPLSRMGRETYDQHHLRLISMTKQQRAQDLKFNKWRLRRAVADVLYQYCESYETEYIFSGDLQLWETGKYGYDENPKEQAPWKWSHLVANWTWIQHALLDLIDTWKPLDREFVDFLQHRLNKMAETIRIRNSMLRKISPFLCVR